MTSFETFASTIDRETATTVAGLMSVVFGRDPDASFIERVREKPRSHLVIAREDAVPVGFKLSYERNAGELYSWLGGVHPEHRGRGIAAEMMRIQHAYASANGYREITTETLGDGIPMLMLNLRHGFVVVGTRQDARGLKVLLRRSLSG